MTGVAEKARSYLEKSVPQLREWGDREIFTKDEIRTIVRRRDSFEFQVLSPGNHPSEWSSYAQWEKSLENLRRKRCQRLKIRQLESAHVGQGRVLNLYERAVNRHPSSGALWREYLQYAAEIKAAKRWRRTMTNALRMMPTDHALWVMAGRRAAANGDMASARSFFMRGCRFCAKEFRVWISYARCEMEWLVKIAKRKGAKGKHPLRQERSEEGDELRVQESDESGDDEENDILPAPSHAQFQTIDEEASKQLKANPAMNGAIPIAIFDIMRKQAFFGPEVAALFFLTVANYRDAPAHASVSQHVLDVMEELYPDHPATCDCYIRQPIMGISPFVGDFPRNLRDVIRRLQQKMALTSDPVELANKTVAWADEYLAMPGLDEGIHQVLTITKETVAGTVGDGS